MKPQTQQNHNFLKLLSQKPGFARRIPKELIEMLSNFLGVKAEQNLRDLSYPVSSFRKLREPLVVELENFRWN